MPLLPKTRCGGAARATGGLILLLVVLGPLAGLDLSDLTVRYEDLSRDMEQQAETYRREGQAQLGLAYTERTRIYIGQSSRAGTDGAGRVETGLAGRHAAAGAA